MKKLTISTLVLVILILSILPSGIAQPNFNKYQPSKPCSDSCWQYVGTPGFSEGVATGTCLTFDYMGNLYLAFVDHEHLNHASVMRYDGSTWSYVGTPGFTSGAADYLSLKFNYYETPYIIEIGRAHV